ncbi:hypothetical protein HZH66_001531 [Vespula vulgaris]|uniref:Uncharacterized protein n=1 Tax=Vespula vulgaris TaxID=7454 RepID=A0A834NJN0_VESVU|nr:hypothetical protein HZH66_001531 [Vespula vulgaris]
MAMVMERNPLIRDIPIMDAGLKGRKVENAKAVDGGGGGGGGGGDGNGGGNSSSSCGSGNGGGGGGSNLVGRRPGTLYF